MYTVPVRLLQILTLAAYQQNKSQNPKLPGDNVVANDSESVAAYDGL